MRREVLAPGQKPTPLPEGAVAPKVGDNEELQEMRDMRDKAKAGARVSREMAGVDSQRSEAEFLQYAEQSVADSEFDALIGLAKETEADAEEPADRTRLPEQ